MTKRFQTFVDDWEYPDKYLGDLYKLEDIETVTVSMIAGKVDTLCPASRAIESAERIKTMDSFIYLENVGHEVA